MLPRHCFTGHQDPGCFLKRWLQRSVTHAKRRASVAHGPYVISTGVSAAERQEFDA